MVLLSFLAGVVFIAVGLWSWFGPRPDPVPALASHGVQTTADRCQGYHYTIRTNHNTKTSFQSYEGVRVTFRAHARVVTADLADLHHYVGVNSRNYTEIGSGSYRCPLRITYDARQPQVAMATVDLDYYRGDAYRRTGELELRAGVLGVLLSVVSWRVMRAYGTRERARADRTAHGRSE